jgi:hypothetical protein
LIGARTRRIVVLSAALIGCGGGTVALGQTPAALSPQEPGTHNTEGCSSARLIGKHRTYDVGPGQRYEELTTVPWLALDAGDVVNIAYRPTPYRTMIALRARGTASAPVILNGVTGPNCARPEISGERAVLAADRAQGGYDNKYSLIGSVINIWWGNGGWGNKPQHITIQNLKITGGTSGIVAVTVEDLLIQNCEVTDNAGWGVFVNTKGDDPHGIETSYRVTLRGNRLYNNGVDGSYLYHNVYVQAYRALYEGNYIGQLRPGASGSSLKDRSSGTIVRYNMIVAAARALDLVETDGGHGTVDADPLYNEAWVYGNIIVSDHTLPAVASGSLIHWGYDNNPARGRSGVLHFYNNTVISVDSEDDWIALFDLPPGPQSVEAQNNIIRHSGSAKFELGKEQGTIRFLGRNWISSGWGKGDPWNRNTVTVVGEDTLIAGANPMLDNGYRPVAESPVIGRSNGTTPTPVIGEFSDPAGTSVRSAALDLGAREH